LWCSTGQCRGSGCLRKGPRCQIHPRRHNAMASSLQFHLFCFAEDTTPQRHQRPSAASAIPPSRPPAAHVLDGAEGSPHCLRSARVHMS
jgi:hypothetical protein